MGKESIRARHTAERSDPATTVECDVDSPQWQEARQRAADVRAVVGEGKLNSASAKVLAGRWSVSARTVQRLVHAYRRQGSLRAFLKHARGVRPGAKMFDGAVEEIIRDVARRWWRQTENATIAEIFPTLIGECRARDLAAPSRATVARRLVTLRSDPENFVGEARAVLRERVRLNQSSYTVARSLSVVQIDHTVADIFIVDPESRECIGRPTLTVAIDVATRCVMGMCLSLEAPSALLVALCLEHAVFPKADWLIRIGVPVEWPMHGQPDALHTDNGREFHSAGFRRGCDLNGIDTIYRPPGTPRFGGHVERLIGTLMRRVRLLPGSSYSDLLGGRPSQAEARAALTLADLQGFMAEDIARYHARPHRALGMSPLMAWNRAWEPAAQGPKMPADRLQFRSEFLPACRRVIGREGIELFGLKYSGEILVPEVAIGTQRVVRFDPRDLSQVYLERAGQPIAVIPLRDSSTPAMSLWEWRALGRRRRELIERPDGERARASLEPSRPAPVPGPTRLQARRRAARAAAWREVQAIPALPVPDIALEPTMTSDGAGGAFAWEVLE